MPISGAVFQVQASKFNKRPNCKETDLKASIGWLDRFKKCHGISKVSVAGEIRSADAEADESYPEKLKQIITDGEYSPEQVYNADETGLCYKMLPGKTLAVKSNKKIKDRITILFCTHKNVTHKVKPLCIGKFQNPTCFHCVNRSTLPCPTVTAKTPG